MAQYTELRYFHLPPKLAQQTSLQVININNLISELQLLLNTKVDKLYNKQLSQKSFTITDKNTISKSLNLIIDLLNLIDSLPDIVLSDWNTEDTTDMSYIKNKPDVPILESGLIPPRYLPSYVDDVLEYDTLALFPVVGERGKIYVDLSTDLTYRWSGSTYIEISKSVITGVKGDAEQNYRTGNVNITAANIGLGNVVNLDLSKAIKGITRNGLTFTYTCLDGTTGTFDQQDNNTTYSGSTTVTLTGTTFSLTKANVTTALGYTPPTTDHTYNFAGVSFTSGQSTTGEHNCNNITSNGVWYYTSNGPATSLGASTTDGALYSQAYSTAWVGLIAQDYRNGRLFVRGKNNNSWLSWLRVALTGESLPASDVYAWAKASTKPSYAFNEISAGTATIGDGTNYILLRSNASWRGGVYWHTTGNEAMVFGNKNSVSSFIFANTDPVDRTQWNTLSPWMQIKKGCVYINSLIGNDVNPSYNLYVNGTANITSTLSQNGNAVIHAGNIGSQSVNYATSAGSASSATSATKSGDGSCILYPELSNELNIGGTNNSTTIYFSYRAKDSRAIATSFVFGGSAGTASITANAFKKRGGTSSLFLKADGSVDSNSYITSTGPGTVKRVDVTLTSYADVGNLRYFFYPMSEADSKRVVLFRIYRAIASAWNDAGFYVSIQGRSNVWAVTVSNTASPVPTSISGYYLIVN